MFRMIMTLLLLLAFTGAALQAQELSGTLLKVQKTGKIKIGYRDDRPPLSYLNQEKVPVGYSIDLCNLIADQVEMTVVADVTIEYVPVTVDNRFDALVDNRIDLLCGATTKTVSRGVQVDFTQLTFVTGASFMTLKGTKIRNNFDGKKIGVVKGTTTVAELSKRLKEAGTDAELVMFDSSDEALIAMDKALIDAFAADQVVLIGLAMTSAAPGKYVVLPELFSYEPFALAVRRNDADFRLVADRVLAELYRSEKILPIYEKWFGDFSRRSSAFDAMVQLNAIPE